MNKEKMSRLSVERSSEVPIIFYAKKDTHEDLSCSISVYQMIEYEIAIESNNLSLADAIQCAEQDKRKLVISKFSSLRLNDVGLLLSKAAEGELRLCVAHDGLEPGMSNGKFREYHKAFETVNTFLSMEK